MAATITPRGSQSSTSKSSDKGLIKRAIHEAAAGVTGSMFAAATTYVTIIFSLFVKRQKTRLIQSPSVPSHLFGYLAN
jgi:hypothetical protein